MIVETFDSGVYWQDDDGQQHSNPVTWQIEYDPNTDPFAVTMTPKVDDQLDTTRSWTFSRELLARGLDTSYQNKASGDVSIWRYTSITAVILLSSPDGECAVHADWETLRAFIVRVYDRVPPDSEGGFLVWDNVIDRIIDWGKSGA